MLISNDVRSVSAAGLVCATVLSATCFLNVTHAQDSAETARRADVEVICYQGHPFCIGFCDVPLHLTERRRVSSGIIDELQLGGNGIYYPVVQQTGPAGVDADSARQYRLYFLFDSGKADHLQLLTMHPPLVPQENEHEYHRTLQEWWRIYRQRALAKVNSHPQPIQIDQYLVSMLSDRLKLPKAEIKSQPFYYDASTERFIGSLTGTEAVRLALQRDALLSVGREEEATESLPKPASPPPIEIPDPDPTVEVEPLAMVVPPENLYIRMRSYDDLVWFADATERWGAELNGFLSVRGMRYNAGARLESQLNLQRSELVRQLTSALVNDMAVIGDDTFIREGAGLGILFQAASTDALHAVLTTQRLKRVADDPEVTLQDIQLDGLNATVSLLSTPDNRVRSWYAVHGA
ncbi:MAG: hypothetical protein KDA85_21910, partial [Planctomycetaceae bacterium]|nr:hypothetical protein [Planctomycetaceae bacterium]